ncbi:MAG: hypothetical protein D6756_01575 [Cyanobacteria bacterium J083]|nr:MAG: hypothetical protein D6756_01575 [Cyanobacteria bacterium J083]
MTTNLVRQEFKNDKLPLAIYLEIIAHIRQVIGVNADLLPYTSEENLQFDYNRSQVKGVWLEFKADLEPAKRQRIEDILNYYEQKYSPWQTSSQT